MPSYPHRDALSHRSSGLSVRDNEPQPDMERMRHYRLGRLQDQIKKMGYAGALLFDPVNVRYATGISNYAVYGMHNPLRCVFVPPEGKCTLFDHDNLEYFGEQLGIFADVRAMPTLSFFYYGNLLQEAADGFCKEIADLVATTNPENRRLAIDRFEPSLARGFAKTDMDIYDAQEPVERARSIKSDDEVTCILHSISVAEEALAEIRAALKPGATENQMAALLQYVNISNGGEWSEYKLISSGGRTNPWGQEATDRKIRAGELLIVDTGMVGPLGYFADLTRTFICEPCKPTDEQKRLYSIAIENIEYNMSVLKPGMTFHEFSHACWKLPDEFVGDRYPTPLHAVGMRGEWPMLCYPIDLHKRGHEGTIEPGMTLSVESYIGAEGGTEGVKLEEQVLVTEDGIQRLSTFPYEELLMA